MRRFANGMFTNNARDLQVGAHQQTAFADDRGRLQGLADLVLEAEESILLALDGLDEDGFTALFRIHLMLEDVEVDSVSDALWFSADPPTAGVSWPTPFGGYLGTEPPAGPDLPFEAFEARRIAAGIPCFADASDKQLPHELGLRETHLHFEKGCYRGQEIIHRIDVMGGVRKGLVGVTLGAGWSGDALVLDGRNVGRLGTTCVHPQHGAIGLAVVRNEHRAPGTVLGCGEGTATLHDLPLQG